MNNSRQLNLILKLKDEVSESLGKVQSKLKSLGPSFQKMAAIGTASFLAITAVVGKSIQAFMAQEKAEKRLEQIAKQVTKSTEAEIEGFIKLASALQKVGVVGDEVIIAGQSQLASFTKNSQVVTELSDDLADLAVAQYGTNVSQEQAIQTANLMGKALQGQLGALTRTGILVSGEFKTAFESANTEQERAVILSKIIQDNYGGVNAAMRETAEGGLQALKNSFGDMQEIIGAVFIPILLDLVKKIEPVIEKIVLWVQENQPLTKNIVLVALAIAGLVAGIGFLGLILPAIITGFGLVGTAIAFLASPIGLLMIAIGALVVYWIRNWDIIKLGFQVVWESITAILTGGANIFISIVEGMVNHIIKMINFFLNGINKMSSSLSALGVNVPKIKLLAELDIPRLAEGGIVSSPTLAMIGEGNESEAVIPLSKLGKYGGGGGGVTINIQTMVGDDEYAERMGDKILNSLKQNQMLTSI